MAITAAIALGLSVLPLGPVFAADPSASETSKHVAGRALVGANPSGRARAQEAIQNRGGNVVTYYAPGNFFIVETPSAAPEWVRSLRSDPRVRYAELDYIVTTDDITPNDTKWLDLWGLRKIGMPTAWDANSNGSIDDPGDNLGSKDAVVGIIDTGVDYNHEDIGRAQMWVNPGETGLDSGGRNKENNGTDDDGNGFVDDVYGADCVNNDGNPIDDNDHGTHVAGTIGAATNNSRGVSGINWKTSIMALKFLNAKGSGSTSDAIECLDYAIAKGADLTNNSWGGGGYSQALWDAIKRAQSAGQLFVAAAGNDSANGDVSPNYPSAYDHDNIVSVAATDSNDNLASFSNYGISTVDIAAPGAGIWSTTRNNGYASYNGTSMATPHVSGAVALILSRYPGLSPQGVLDRLYGSVDKVSSLTGKVRTEGRLNVARAIEEDLAASGPVGMSVSGSTRTSVSLSWTAPYENGTSGGAASSYQLSYTPSGTGAWATAPAPNPALPPTGQSTTVSGLKPNTNYDFRLTSLDNAGNTSSEIVTGSTGAGAVIFSDDMEGTSAWAADAPWAITAERPHSPTRSRSDSPNGSHANSKEVSVRSPSFSLAGATNPKLTFWHRYNLEPNYDYSYVEISINGGSTWTQLARYNGHQDEHKPVELSLATYAGASDVRLRFRLKTDGSVVYDGWYFDDVVVSKDSADSIPPAAPTGLTVSNAQTGGNLVLDWADNTEPDLAGYNVYRTTDAPTAATRTWTKVNAGLVTASTYTDTGLVNSTAYYYYVTAADTSSNESGPSNEASATPNVALIALSARAYKVKGLQKVDLTWSGATAALDVFRNGVLIVTATANDGAYTDPINRKGPGTYIYKVCETGTTTCSNEVTAVF